MLQQDRKEREDTLLRTLWATDFYVELYVVYAYTEKWRISGPQNAVECSDAELIDFAELLIMILKNNVKEI